MNSIGSAKDKLTVPESEFTEFIEAYLKLISDRVNLEVMLDGEPEQQGETYVCYYNSREWVENRDMNRMVLGGPPFTVDLSTRQLRHGDQVISFDELIS